jgi:EAL domain-containing protein (putative c-di-GMP-specific phosphodiesterase class I)
MRATVVESADGGNFRSVAEGVQQRSDWDLLDELGCDVMQGFFIARPMTEEGLDAWTAQWTLRKR